MRPSIKQLLFLLALLAPLTLHAQAPDPSTRTSPPDRAILSGYLHSGDPRLVAWGATFVQQAHDDTFLPDLIGLASTWRSAGNDAKAAEQSFAMEAVLDTLIQMQATPGAEAIESVAISFPTQSVILLSRISPTQDQSVLMRLYQTGGQSSWLTRGVADLLAQNPTQEFVAGLLNGMPLQLHVTVLSMDSPGVGNGGFDGSCIAHSEPPPDKDWPTLYHYDLGESATGPYGDRFLVITSPVPIVGARVAGSELHRRYCGISLPPEHRQRLIAQMLGVKLEDLGWKVDEYQTLRVASIADYTLLLGNLVKAYQAHVEGTLQALKQKGLLAQEDATTRPSIKVKILDNRSRDAHTALLPIPSSLDERLQYTADCFVINPYTGELCR